MFNKIRSSPGGHLDGLALQRMRKIQRVLVMKIGKD
uniref:Uncharacterized protein n=1 Tax=Arundo donax TaxID=35708 RepID=A0A0A8Z2U3_ARUDO